MAAIGEARKRIKRHWPGIWGQSRRVVRRESKERMGIPGKGWC